MLRKPLGLVSALALACTPYLAFAATFDVSNPTEFQNALTTAQSNGESDTINVAAGFYNILAGGTLTYTATATENATLTITGANSTTVILDGGSQVPILRIDTTAVINDSGVGVEVHNMTFQNGSASGTPADGGALAILTDESLQPAERAVLVWIGGSEFYGNTATGDGGAVFVRAHAVEGIYLDDLTFDRYQVDATTFVSNQAGGNGGGAYVAGGLFTTPIALQNIDFFYGIAGGSGGGLAVEGFDPDTPSAYRAQSVSFFDISFYGNQSNSVTGGGGGADVGALSLAIDTVGFVDNSARTGGGLRIRPNWGGISVVNTGFAGNTASADGGGMAAEETFFNTLTLTNNTFSENVATNRGGGAFLLFDSSSSIAQIYNNIIYGNTAQQGTGDDLYVNNRALDDIGATTELFNNDITDYDVGPVAVVEGFNINAPPLFVDIAARPLPDPRLQAGSPAIDAGDDSAPGAPTRDFEFDARPFDGDGDMTATIDIGMDEYTGAVAQNADLAVTKTDDPDPVTEGGNITYTVTVTNNGPGAATNVTLTDTYDALTAFVSATATQGTCADDTGTVTCDLGTLANGATATVTIVVTTPDVMEPLQITNMANVSGTEPDPVGTNDSATELTTVVPAGPAMADLAITKIDTPDPVVSGGPALTYDITVTNNGPDAATGVTVTDTVLLELPINDATSTVGSCIINGLQVTCTIGDLAVDATATVTITVLPGPVETSTDFDNTADVTGNETDPVAGNNSSTVTTTVTPPGSDMMVSVVATPTSPSIGETVTYDITVMNDGPSDNLGVGLSITLPTMGTFQRSSISQGKCSAPSDGVIDCVIGDMLSGATVTVQVVFTAPDEAASMVMSAAVLGSVADPTGGNNTDSESVSVIEAVDLIIQGTSKGTGSLAWPILLVLALAAIASLWRSRQTLAPLALVGLALIGLTLPVTQAHAQDDWYVGVSLGKAGLDYSAGDLQQDLSNLGWSINNPSVNESDTAWKAYAGFAVNDYFAIEGGYADLGKVVTQFGATIPPSQIDAILSDTFSVHPYQGDGWFAAAVLTWPVSPDRFNAFARIGMWGWESNLDVRVISGGSGSITDRESGTDMMYALGVEWQYNEQWSLTAEWERYKLNEWLDVPSIGLRFAF